MNHGLVLPATSRGGKLVEHLGSALIVAGALGIVGFMAAESFAAIFKLEGVNSLAIAQKTFYWTGSFAVIGALLLLAVGH